MSTTLVLAPVSTGQAASLCRDGRLQGCQAFTVNAQLLDTLDLSAADDEGAEYACMVLASVWGLATHGERLVLAAEVPAAQVAAGDEAHNGGVQLRELSLRQVQSVFADEREQPEAAAAVQGMSLDQAWETAAVQRLVREGDLLWHGAEELPQLAARQEV
ncbi:DUF6912 family protein [Luteococcus sp. OSA5]|uniref:DUF6912 family protein n=1 Tax=Luteococcus sp. OSA5 TaxID=3401630 RepID=UPI003B431A7E